MAKLPQASIFGLSALLLSLPRDHLAKINPADDCLGGLKEGQCFSRKPSLELLAPPPSRHDHSGVVRPLSYSRPHQAGTTTPMAASRASRGSASSKPSIIGVLAERHACHLAERAQTLQDACKPMHTDPSTIWVICYQRTTQEPFPSQTSGRTSSSVLLLFAARAVQDLGACYPGMYRGSRPTRR